MVGEVRRGEDGAGAAARQRELAEALQEAHRLLDDPSGRPPAEALVAMTDRLGRLETELAQHGEDFAGCFVVRGLVLGAYCLNRGERTSSGSGSAERTEALRRLRWTDRHGPTDNPLAVQARMMLVFLLAPWALPRGDGTTTVLRDALLTPGQGEDLLTESVRRDLTEAKEVVHRIAEAPFDAEFQQRTADVQQVLERMLAPGLLSSGTTAEAVATDPAAPDGERDAFHHHLTAGGLAPPDALRAAQSWMLDPHRRLPFPLDEPLRHEAARSDLHQPHHWAAFTHQGKPAPAWRS
ncbi:hypothetical protein [Streptomyces tricolor]|uniref:hypothetical protein n=1 Tax=Streptomyces tricolor TaxID=68277 RepID=UPI0039DFA90D